MRILTVRQPWAWAIIHGGKNVENRVRNIAGSYRGPVVIHAGMREDTGARQHPEIRRLARDVWGTTADDLLTGRRDQFGHIIGVVDLTAVHFVDEVGCMAAIPECSPWAEIETGVWHLRFENPRPLSEPIPYKGALGLRHLDDDTTARILAQIGATA